jgi:hypothetical protein
MTYVSTNMAKCPDVNLKFLKIQLDDQKSYCIIYK